MPEVEAEMAARYLARKRLLDDAAAAGYVSPVSPADVALSCGESHGLSAAEAREALWRIQNA